MTDLIISHMDLYCIIIEPLYFFEFRDVIQPGGGECEVSLLHTTLQDFIGLFE